MKYMLLCYDEEEAWAEVGKAAQQKAMEEAVGLTHELHARGQYLLASPLHPGSTATSDRERDGQRVFTGGPFSEQPEDTGSFLLIDVKYLHKPTYIYPSLPGSCDAARGAE